MKIFLLKSVLFFSIFLFPIHFSGSDASAVEKQTHNLNFAFSVWAKENGQIQEGKMTIKRFPGKPTTEATILDQLELGDMTYTAYFKGGVVAYDEKKNEYFVLFHPEDKYAWPTILKHSGDFLIIGTRGEGLAVVHLTDSYLKRIALPFPDNEVRSLSVSHSVVIINGSREIAIADV